MKSEQYYTVNINTVIKNKTEYEKVLKKNIYTQCFPWKGFFTCQL